MSIENAFSPFTAKMDAGLRDGSGILGKWGLMSPHAQSVHNALMQVDQGQLSIGERGVLLGLTQRFSADGYLSAADAQDLKSLIDSFSEPDIFGNEATRFWPFSQSIDSGPASKMFLGTLGYFAARVMQAFADAMFTGCADALIGQCGDDPGAATLQDALGKADLSQLDGKDRARIITMISIASVDGNFNTAEQDAIANELGVELPPRADVTFGDNSLQTFDDGRATIDLGNGYLLKLNENSSEMVLLNQSTGEMTRVWGDPHIDLNGDGNDDATFKETTTLNLADGTKITISTIPAGNGETLSSKLTITRDNHAMIVTGLASRSDGELQVAQLDGLGDLADLATEDGSDIFENPFGSGWLAFDGLFLHKAGQDDLP